MIDDTDRIKQALDDPHGLCEELGLLGQFGREWLRQAGNGVMILCPFDHDERSPSCSVVLGRDGTIGAHCFGCGASGDAFHLIAKVLRLDVRADFPAVLDHAADLAGVARPQRGGDRPSTVRAIPKRPPPVEVPDDGVIALVAEVLERLAPVTRSAWGMEYLRSRGLDRGAALGWYAVADGGARENLRLAIIESIGLDAWMRSGLASVREGIEGQWSSLWRGPRVVIPWRDPSGAVATLQGRYVGPDREDARKYVFPRLRPARWPYNVEAVAHAGGDTLMVATEGSVDAESFGALAYRHGVDALALGLPGVSTFPDEWLLFFARRPCLVAFDNDAPGRKAAPIQAARLRAVALRGDDGPRVSLRFPVGVKDWNDVLRAAPAAETRAA